jgi:hypothetical protein
MEAVTSELEPGLQALKNFRDLLREALHNCHVQVKRVSGTWDSQGYFVDESRFFIGLYVANPTILKIRTEMPLSAKTPDTVPIGMLVEGGSRWECTLDLASEETLFFTRPMTSQLACLEQFVQESITFGRTLFEEHPSN